MQKEVRMAKELKLRSEVEKEYTWATEDLYASDDAWYADLEEAKKIKNKVSTFAGKLSSSAKIMLEFFEFKDEISIKADRIFSYAARKRDEDTKNAKYQAMYGALMAVYVELTEALSFETPEIIAIPEETIQQFLEEEKGLLLYRRYLDSVRRLKEHVLSEKEEKLLAAARD